MTEQLEINGQTYLKASAAAKRVGYSPDYVTRLARSGKVKAEQTNRQWFVDPESLKLFSLQSEAEKRERSEQLREERIQERAEKLKAKQVEAVQDQIVATQGSAIVQTAAVALSVFVVANLMWFSIESRLNVANLSEGMSELAATIGDALLPSVPEFFSQVASFAFVERSQSVVSPPSTVEGSGVVSSDDSDFEGIVVFGNDASSTARLESVRESFSDEVEVEFDGTDTGVIRPVFRERSGDAYRFLMVPIRPPDK